MRTMRAAVTDVTTRHGNVCAFATFPCNYVQILAKAANTVVAAIDDVAGRMPVSQRTW
jgi:hypothetical protein